MCSEHILCLQSHRKLFAKVYARFRVLEVTFLAIIIITEVFELFITYNTLLFNFLIKQVVLLVHPLFFQMKRTRKLWTSWDVRCPKTKDLGLTRKPLIEQEIVPDLWIWAFIILSKHNSSSAVVSNTFSVDHWKFLSHHTLILI